MPPVTISLKGIPINPRGEGPNFSTDHAISQGTFPRNETNNLESATHGNNQEEEERHQDVAPPLQRQEGPKCDP